MHDLLQNTPRARFPAAALGLGLIVLAGAASRLVRLENRPMHCDEAVHAVKLGDLLEAGRYVYDPHEYHGPTLNYLTLPVAWAASIRRLADLSEVHLRLVPALCGAALVAMVWLLRGQMGLGGAVCAAMLTAASPAMVFYSRYYIQEMLLVAFTFGAIIAMWRWAAVHGDGPASGVAGDSPALPPGPQSRGFPEQSRGFPEQSRGFPGKFRGFPDGCCGPLGIRVLWLLALGACIGLMHASKETCVAALGAMAVAGAVSMRVPPGLTVGRALAAAALVAVTAAAVSAIFFSSFLSHPRGVVDSYATYAHYFHRAVGEGSAGSHAGPWYQYAAWLLWWPGGDGMVWTELPVALLALAGSVAAVTRRGIRPEHVPFARFLLAYTVLLAAAYSVLPYKTPWCALGFWHGAILLGGVGAAVLFGAARGLWRLPMAAGVAAMVGLLGWQAYRASFVAEFDPRNPYVYAHPTDDVLDLGHCVEQVAAEHPDGAAMHVQVLCPDDDFWPLPWYFRRLEHVGWFARKPRVGEGPPAPLIVIQPEMEPLLVEYLLVDQPPGKRRLYVPLRRDAEDRPWLLRPGVPVVVWVRLDLWERLDEAAPVAGAGR